MTRKAHHQRETRLDRRRLQPPVRPCWRLARRDAPADAACRGPVRGAQLTGINQTLTEFRARTSWRNRVRAIHGYRFARWSYARNKNMECNKARPGRTWSCRAIASPCDRPPRSPEAAIAGG